MPTKLLTGYWRVIAHCHRVTTQLQLINIIIIIITTTTTTTTTTFFFFWRYNPHWGLYFTAL